MMVRLRPSDSDRLSEEGGRGDRTNVVQNRDAGYGRPGESVSRLQKVRIQILRAVRQAGHDGHHEQQVSEAGSILPKDAKHRADRALMMKSAMRWTPERAQRKNRNQNRNRKADTEHRAPAQMRQHGFHGDGGEQDIRADSRSASSRKPSRAAAAARSPRPETPPRPSNLPCRFRRALAEPQRSA